MNTQLTWFANVSYVTAFQATVGRHSAADNRLFKARPRTNFTDVSIFRTSGIRFDAAAISRPTFVALTFARVFITTV